MRKNGTQKFSIRRNKKSAVYCVLLLIFALSILACGKSSSGNDGAANTPPPGDHRFSGTWQGSLIGDPAHFVGNPAVTLVLNHSDTLLTGTLATSDSAFTTVAFNNGKVQGDSIFFEVIQSTIYPGARVKFSGKVFNTVISGDWNHSRLHQGEWSVSKN